MRATSRSDSSIAGLEFAVPSAGSRRSCCARAAASHGPIALEGSPAVNTSLPASMAAAVSDPTSIMCACICCVRQHRAPASAAFVNIVRLAH